MSLSRQKFYELCVVKTFQGAKFVEENPFHDELKKLGISHPENLTFDELIMRRELIGLPPIPKKENFKEWGVGYLAQLLGFVEHSNDVEFMHKFFRFLRENKSLLENSDDMNKFGDLCLNVYTNKILDDRTFTTMLGSYMVMTFEKCVWYDEFIRTAFALATMDQEATTKYWEVKDCWEKKEKKNGVK